MALPGLLDSRDRHRAAQPDSSAPLPMTGELIIGPWPDSQRPNLSKRVIAQRLVYDPTDRASWFGRRLRSLRPRSQTRRPPLRRLR
jgi:hypothetical protein